MKNVQAVAQWYATGDVGLMECGEMYWIGRSDLQFKRSGHRLHPELIAELVKIHVADVSRCAVLLHSLRGCEAAQLVVCVAMRASPGAGSHLAPRPLVAAIRSVLPAAAAPDLVLIAAEPWAHTTNGKLDMDALRNVIDSTLTTAEKAKKVLLPPHLA